MQRLEVSCAVRRVYIYIMSLGAKGLMNVSLNCSQDDEMFLTKVAETFETLILYSITFFSKIVPFVR